MSGQQPARTTALVSDLADRLRQAGRARTPSAPLGQEPERSADFDGLGRSVSTAENGRLPVAEAAAAWDSGILQIKVMPVGIWLPAREGETITRALIRSGFMYRFGCKRGGCGICKVHLVAGEVGYERTVAPSVLSDRERAAGVCLSCRAMPLSDIIIEMAEGDRLRLAVPVLREAALQAARRVRKPDPPARQEPAGLGLHPPDSFPRTRRGLGPNDADGA
jgi:ferredoxin